jgi:transcriptional antiterminator RfaH
MVHLWGYRRMSAKWYTLFSKPRKETQIENYLASKGIEIFYPTLKIDPVNPRAARVRGFFPRYLFIHVDLEEVGISGLEWIPGAVGLVQFGGVPAEVPDAFIDDLRHRLIQIERVGGLHLDGLKQGDKVKITSGPFAGLEAVFDPHLSAEQRVQVLLHPLSRRRRRAGVLAPDLYPACCSKYRTGASLRP